MYTTSRYASEATRRIARSFAKMNMGRYEARGKKTIAHLADEARRTGDDAIFVIEERGKKAAIIAEISVDERGRWRWVGEKPFNPSARDLRG